MTDRDGFVEQSLELIGRLETAEVGDDLTERLTKVAYATEFLDVRADILALIERDRRRWLDNIAVCDLLAKARAERDAHLSDRPRR